MKLDGKYLTSLILEVLGEDDSVKFTESSFESYIYSQITEAVRAKKGRGGDFDLNKFSELIDFLKQIETKKVLRNTSAYKKDPIEDTKKEIEKIKPPEKFIDLYSLEETCASYYEVGPTDLGMMKFCAKEQYNWILKDNTKKVLSLAEKWVKEVLLQESNKKPSPMVLGMKRGDEVSEFYYKKLHFFNFEYKRF